MLVVVMAQVAMQAHMAVQFNSGQVCTAASRTFVHEAIYDQARPRACPFHVHFLLSSPDHCSHPPLHFTIHAPMIIAGH